MRSRQLKLGLPIEQVLAKDPSSINETDEVGLTPLSHAVSYWLLWKGRLRGNRMNFSETPSSRILVDAYKRMIVRLIKHGADVNFHVSDDQTLLRLLEASEARFAVAAYCQYQLLAGLSIPKLSTELFEFLQKFYKSNTPTDLSFDILIKQLFIWRRHAIVDAISQLPNGGRQIVGHIFANPNQGRYQFLSQLFTARKSNMQYLRGLSARKTVSARQRLLRLCHDHDALTINPLCTTEQQDMGEAKVPCC